jgi:thioesterase domain-containing protein
VLFYQPLASALGNDQPVYAFRPYLSVHKEGSAVTLTEMAAAYVKELRAMLPNGPYLIGGLSYGGLVAVEMARELVAQGIEPTLVAVMDASVPGSSKHLGARDQLSALFDNLRRDGVMYLVRKARLKRKYLTRKIVHRAQLLMASRHNPKKGKAPANLRYAQIEDAHLRAIAHHEFKPFSGSIMLLRAANRGYEGVTSLSEIEDPTLGWGELILGKLDICDVPANHLNMLLEPNVREVARLLTQAALRQSQQVTPLK